LKQNRPLDEDKVKSKESDLLLSDNHFAIHHEGNNLKLDETRMMVNIMSVKTDWKHSVEADELSKEMKEKIKQPDIDLKEARNHIFVADKLPELSGLEISENLVLQMHKWIMSGLLTDKSEGLVDEYRKCPIQISGSSIARPLESEVAPMMKSFFEQTIEKKEDEDLMEYISRIHNEFQLIHPFRDGNGRIGRLIMNLALIKHGYPILVLSSGLSNMFNHACEFGNRGSLDIFTRLMAEATFKSLHIYEKALPSVNLSPSIEELLGAKVADVSATCRQFNELSPHEIIYVIPLLKILKDNLCNSVIL
jgi:hypothetical protein